MEQIKSEKVAQGLSIVLAYTLMTPLIEDIQDTFGNAFLYHPVTLWLCITTLVYTQTNSIPSGLLVVVMYETLKAVWRNFRPDPPYIGQVRKLLHRLQDKNAKLSDHDLQFLDSITPSDVTVKRQRML